jgi:Flp pilus assembly pilin Flp
MFQLLKRIWQEDEAQNLAEYALLLTMGSLTMVVTLTWLAATTDHAFFHAVYAFIKLHTIYG